MWRRVSDAEIGGCGLRGCDWMGAGLIWSEGAVAWRLWQVDGAWLWWCVCTHVYKGVDSSTVQSSIVHSQVQCICSQKYQAQGNCVGMPSGVAWGDDLPGPGNFLLYPQARQSLSSALTPTCLAVHATVRHQLY